MTSEQIKEAQQTIIDRIKDGSYQLGIFGKLDIGRRLVDARLLGFSSKGYKQGCFMLRNDEILFVPIDKFQPKFYAHSNPENVDRIFIKLGDVDSTFTVVADQDNNVWSAGKSRLSTFRAETTIDGVAYTLSRDQLSAIKDIAEGKVDPRDLVKERTDL